MKDKTLREIREHQMVVQVNTKENVIGVVRDGFTKGGSARIVNVATGVKVTTKPENLIILSRNQAVEFARGIIVNYEAKKDAVDLMDISIERKERRYEAIDSRISNLNFFIEVIIEKGNARSLVWVTR